MEITFRGTPQQVRNEMQEWLSQYEDDPWANLNRSEKLVLNKNFEVTGEPHDRITLSEFKDVCFAQAVPFKNAVSALLANEKITPKRNMEDRYYTGIKMKEKEESF